MNISSCFYCKEFYYEKQLTKDHIIPKSKGGTNHKMNIVICCKNCNYSKGSLSLTKLKCFCQKQIDLNKADDYIVKKYNTIINSIDYLIVNRISNNFNEMQN